MDEVGEPDATKFRRRWARQWNLFARDCPCGERGAFHAPRSREGECVDLPDDRPSAERLAADRRQFSLRPRVLWDP